MYIKYTNNRTVNEKSYELSPITKFPLNMFFIQFYHTTWHSSMITPSTDVKRGAVFLLCTVLTKDLWKQFVFSVNEKGQVCCDVSFYRMYSVVCRALFINFIKKNLGIAWYRHWHVGHNRFQNSISWKIKKNILWSRPIGVRRNVTSVQNTYC